MPSIFDNPSQSVLSNQADIGIAPSPSQEGHRDFLDPTKTRTKIYDKVLNSISNIGPLKNVRHTLELVNPKYVDPPDFDLEKQKQAVLTGKSLNRRIKGTWKLTDNTSNQVLDQRDMTVAQVPYMSPRGTFIVNGTEYSLSNQMRLRPGIFTRIKENGEIESHVNVLPGNGISHRYFLDPETGIFKINIGQAKLPLYPILKAIGISDKQMRKAWGDELLAANLRAPDGKAVTKFYQRLIRKADPNATEEQKGQSIADLMLAMKVDPEVTKNTLGYPHEYLTKDAILDTTKKLVKVSRQEEDPDDRDHLAYQTLHGPEDLLSERITKDKLFLRQLLWKASFKGNLQGMQPGALSKMLLSTITSSGLGNPTESINALELLDAQSRVTRLGLGGIGSLDSVPEDSRSVMPSHLNFIDPVRTPESAKVGIDTHLAYSARKGADGRLYAPFIDVKSGKTVYKSPQDVADQAVAFPGEFEKNKPYVAALVKGDVRFIPREEAKLVLPHMEGAFSPLGNLIPLKSALKGQRMAMGSRYIAQALSLTQREAPYLQSALPGQHMQRSFSDEYGKYAGAVHSKDGGTVKKITPNEIVVKHDNGETETYPTYNNFPFSRKTYFHNEPMVGVGDRVEKDQLLAKSNYTDDRGTLALGLNARIAFIPFRGANYEDAVVISDSFAKRLSSEHMYQHEQEWNKNTKKGLKPFISLFPTEYTKEQLQNMDDKGAIKPGSVVHFGDPLVLSAEQKEKTHSQIHKGRKPSYANKTITWEHHAPGIVTDVAATSKGTTVAVKSYNPMQSADKLCYSSDTEVLTDKGWKVITDVSVDDTLTSLNPAYFIEYLKPVAIHKYEHSSKLYSVVNSLVDLLVTDNHRLLAKIAGNNEFELIEAKELYSKKYALLNMNYAFNVNAEQQEDKWQEYSGFVYGLELPRNHILYVRRNGKPHWSGNSNLFGGKGVVADIIPDDQMLHDKEGKPYEALLNPLGIISRINPVQIAEMSLGKIANKTGIPYKMEDFSKIPDLVKFTQRELKKHGVDPLETIVDPNTGREIPNVLTGYQYLLKLHHTAESKGQGRGLGGYSCFDSETEVLTRRGWVPWPKVLDDDEFATPVGNEFVYQQATSITREHYSGVMYGFEGKFVDYLVTPNHRMYVNNHKHDGFRFEQASDIHNNHRIVDQFGNTQAICNSGYDHYYTLQYNNLVYCSTIPNGLLYVRRNGKPIVTGNSEEIPVRGGSEGSKKIGMLETNALLSSGATEFLRDAHLVRGQKNDEYWQAFMAGFRPPEPKVPLIYSKFVDGLKASGINVVRDGRQLHIMALTDKDVNQLAGNRDLDNVDTVDWKAGLKPRRGGLFDQSLTGGHSGNRWSAIKLTEPLPNPAFEEPIRRLLNLTQKNYESILFGNQDLPGFGSGPQAIKQALDNINVDKDIDKAQAEVKGSKRTIRDEAIRKLAYLKSAKRLNIHPKDWILSRVPVLPPIYRPVSVMQGTGSQMVADPNYLYKELFDSNQVLGELKGQIEDLSAERKNVYNAFKGVVGLGKPISPKNQERQVKGILKNIFGNSPKFGTVQRQLLGATVELVGRAVIAPEPNFDMDSVGVPENKAWEVYKPFIIRKLVQKGVPRLEAVRSYTDKTPMARNVMLAEMKERPVVISRAPVLHRYGIMGHWPKLINGDVMKLPPIVYAGYGGDNDGDSSISMLYLALTKETYLNRIPEEFKPFWRTRHMAARFNTAAHYKQGFEFFCVNIEDIPHTEEHTENGNIKFHGVPPGMFVCAYDQKNCKPILSEISGWSEHKDCKIVTVELQSGRQILTDDDPRAVYGYNPIQNTFGRWRPSESVGVFVPRAHTLPEPEVTVTELPMQSKLRLLDTLKLNYNTGWLFGVIIGDGWVSKRKGNQVGVCLAGINEGIIEKFREVLLEVFVDPPKLHFTIGRTSYGRSEKYTVSSKEFAVFIEPYIGVTAQKKHLPSFYLSTSREFRLGLAAGLMATDGSVAISNSKKNQQLVSNFSTTSIRLAQEFQHLLRTLDISSRVGACKTPAGEPCWLLTICAGELKASGIKLFHTDKDRILEDGPTPDMSSGAAIRHDLIPINPDLARLLAQKIGFKNDKRLYEKFTAARNSCYVSRYTANKLLSSYSAPEHPAWQTFVDMTNNKHIRWDQVTGYTNTDIIETGYDITVPDSETFMSVDGVILSNTMNYHVPATEEAKQEVIDKLLPSKNLLATSTFKIHYVPTMEYLGGLYHATTAKDEKKRPHVFRNKQDAIRAYHEGRVAMDSPVEILDH